MRVVRHGILDFVAPFRENRLVDRMAGLRPSRSRLPVTCADEIITQ